MNYITVMMASDNNKSEVRGNIIFNVQQAYAQKQYNKEILARIIQYSRTITKGYKRDHLLRNTYKLFGRYSEAKARGYAGVLNRIDSMSSRLRNKEDIEKVSQTYFGENEQAALDKAPSFNIIKKNKHRSYRQVEIEFCGDVVSELRKIYQMIRDKDARNLVIPQELLKIETDRAPEVIFAEAKRDSADYNEKQKIEKLQGCYDKLSKTNSDKEYNENMLYVIAHCGEMNAGNVFKCANIEEQTDKKSFLNKLSLLIDVYKLDEEFKASDLKVRQMRSLALISGKGVEDKIKFVHYLGLVYGDLFPKEKNHFVLNENKSLNELFEDGKNFACNFSLVKTSDKSDGLTLEGLKEIGTKENLLMMLQSAKLNINNITSDWLDTSKMPYQDMDNARLMRLMALHEIYKEHFPEQKMPGGLRLDNLKESSLRSTALEIEISLRVGKLQKQGAFGPDKKLIKRGQSQLNPLYNLKSGQNTL